MKKEKPEVDTVGQIGNAHIACVTCKCSIKFKTQKNTYAKFMENSSLEIVQESDKSVSTECCTRYITIFKYLRLFYSI
jgi:chaperonin GroEL (HSP60 family)